MGTGTRGACGAGWSLGSLLLIALGLWPASMTAGAKLDMAAFSRPVGSVFFIAKSENRNQVHYGVRVDERCRPKGSQPIYGYWRDYEDGPKATSKLLDHEQPAYGVTRPKALERTDHGGRVLFGLRGLPAHRVTVQVFKQRGDCRAWAITTIAGEPALLHSIYVELGFLFSIDYVLMRGIGIARGNKLREKVED